MTERRMTETERAALAREIALAVSRTDADPTCACEGHAGASTPADLPVSGLAGAVDLSLQQPDATRTEVERFLRAARPLGFRSVCVEPRWASLAVRELAGTPSRVASYVGYPHGTALTPTKCAEAELLLRLGVEELWTVAAIGALRAGDLDAAFVDLRAVAQVSECRRARLTVVLDLPLLSERQAVEACVVAKLAGATGAASATRTCAPPTQPHHIELMRQTLGDDLEIVASGGIDTVPAARSLLAAGATRVELGGGLQILTAP
ncbi:MAG: deoxyribose-phosphate aldolase [Bryobacterales bacterium]|nr:deoxyribose-phosphate aldolase [Bryobacterales bacterium]